jgi:energy-converting hydrogenase Eha subunit E
VFFSGLYTGLVAFFFVGVPTVGVVVILVQLPELLPVWTFRAVALLGPVVPLPIFLTLVSRVSGP